MGRAEFPSTWKKEAEDIRDREIIDLYWQRSDMAIAETDAVYGRYCYTVAFGVLGDREDSDESVNDAYLAAWNAMPPNRPESLKAFLGKLTRRISISKLRRRNSRKRGGGEVLTALDELSECVPSSFDTGAQVELKELTEAINGFLAALPERERRVFTARYWYVLPVEKIGAAFGLKTNTVKSILRRTRIKLMEHLKEEGLC